MLDDGREAALRLVRNHDIVWMTGRPERIREQTLAWLASHGLPGGPLYMQPKGDCRLARRVKVEHLHAIAAEHSIAIVLDDDPRVVELLRDTGFPAELATWLPWTPALRP